MLRLINSSNRWFQTIWDRWKHRSAIFKTSNAHHWRPYVWKALIFFAWLSKYQYGYVICPSTWPPTAFLPVRNSLYYVSGSLPFLLMTIPPSEWSQGFWSPGPSRASKWVRKFSLIRRIGEQKHGRLSVVVSRLSSVLVDENRARSIPFRDYISKAAVLQKKKQPKFD